MSSIPVRTISPSQKALDRDNFMSPEEAKEWGHIDEIVENRGKTEDPDAPKPKKGK